MKFRFLDNEVFNDDYLSSMSDGEKLRMACVDAMHGANSLEQLLDLRVELIVLSLRLAELKTYPHLYAYLPRLLGDLQSKIGAEKLKRGGL